jgi:TFIIF, beta subunit HTH domain
MNASYSKTVKSRVQEANQPKRQVRMLSDQNGIPDGSYLYNPKSNQPFGKFTGGSARTKADAQNNKATRIPKNELLDLLFKCFQEYAYWSLKGLREYVKQPEVYPSAMSLITVCSLISEKRLRKSPISIKEALMLSNGRLNHTIARVKMSIPSRIL